VQPVDCRHLCTLSVHCNVCMYPRTVKPRHSDSRERLCSTSQSAPFAVHFSEKSQHPVLCSPCSPSAVTTRSLDASISVCTATCNLRPKTELRDRQVLPNCVARCSFAKRQLAVPCAMAQALSVTGPSPRRHEFDPRSTRAAFIGNKVELGRVLVALHVRLPPSVSPPPPPPRVRNYSFLRNLDSGLRQYISQAG
jgi:hypothetical protein